MRFRQIPPPRRAGEGCRELIPERLRQRPRPCRRPPEPQYPLAIPFSPHLFREFMQARFDLVHTHSPFTLGQVARRWAGRAGLPVVTTYHTLYTEYTHYVPVFPQELARGWIRK